MAEDRSRIRWKSLSIPQRRAVQMILGMMSNGLKQYIDYLKWAIKEDPDKKSHKIWKSTPCDIMDETLMDSVWDTFMYTENKKLEKQLEEFMDHSAGDGYKPNNEIIMEIAEATFMKLMQDVADYMENP